MSKVWDKPHLSPATRIAACESSDTGLIRSLQSGKLISSMVRHVKESEGHLSQWINCDASNAGTKNDSFYKVGG
jgi:hypothetical protein